MPSWRLDLFPKQIYFASFESQEQLIHLIINKAKCSNSIGQLYSNGLVFFF